MKMNGDRSVVILAWYLLLFCPLFIFSVLCHSDTGRQRYSLPRGTYHLEFLAKSRSETDLRYQYSVNSVFTIAGPDSKICEMNLVAKEKSDVGGENIYEYRSSSTGSGGGTRASLLLYMNSSTCYYSDVSQANSAMLSLEDLNAFLSSLRPYVGKERVPFSTLHHHGFDKTASDLFRRADLVSWIGTISIPGSSSSIAAKEGEEEDGDGDVMEEEYLILFTDFDGVPKYLLGQHLYISFTKFEAMEAKWNMRPLHHLENTIKQLKHNCISLLDDLYMLYSSNRAGVLKLKRRSGRRKINNNNNNRKNTNLPWFLKEDESCSFHYIRDHERCQQALQLQNLKQETAAVRKVCVFLHGAGIMEHNTPPSDTFVKYWGDVTKYTPQCSKHLFIHADTKNYGWDSDNLQEEYCNLAVYHNTTRPHEQQGDEHEQGLIKNTIIFTHSMGNLILAAAIKNGVCKLDKTSSKWYAIDAPYGGSHASSKVQEICEQYYNKKNSTIPIPLKTLYGFIATKGGYCNPSTGDAYYAYKVCDPNYCHKKQRKGGIEGGGEELETECLSDLEGVVVENVSGLMCGLSPIGLYSRYSILLQVLSAVVNFGEENDGMLGKSSCMKYHQKQQHLFTNNFRDAFYRTQLNHADGTCRNGNGMFSDGRKPCSFYSYRL